MKIDIVVSEFGKASDKKKSKTVPPSVAGNKGSRNRGNLNASFQNLAVYSSLEVCDNWCSACFSTVVLKCCDWL
jgi:hypothetical protein